MSINITTALPKTDTSSYPVSFSRLEIHVLRTNTARQPLWEHWKAGIPLRGDRIHTLNRNTSSCKKA